MNFFERFSGHLKTICSHKYKVFQHCMKAGLIKQGITHDLSKFSPTEFIPGVKYFQGYRSPNEAEREQYGYSRAWLHHKGRNRHHYEYWNDFDAATKMVVPVKMPLKFVIEMFCDRVAASKTYMKEKYTDDCPLQYYNRRKDHDGLHKETAELLLRLLEMLAEKGEAKTFAYIKKLKRKKAY